MKFSLLFIFFQLVSTASLACSCVPYKADDIKHINQSYAEASSVVIAKVVGIENLNPEETIMYNEERGRFKKTIYHTQRTSFITEKSWKGNHGSEFYTDITVSCCACGFRFEVGQSYLLYLDGPDNKGFYSTSSCHRSSKMKNGLENEIRNLNKIHLIG